MKKAFRVFLKDVHENSGSYILVTGILLGMLTILPIFQSRDLLPSIQLEFVFNLNLVALVAFGNWLVARERERKTIIILRTLPLTTRQLVAGKFLAAFAMSEGLYIASLVSSFAMLKYGLHTGMIATPQSIVLGNLLLLGLLAILLATYTIFPSRTAVMFPLGVIFLLLLAWLSLEKLLIRRGISMEPLWKRLTDSHLFPIIVALIVTLIVIAAFRASERYIESRDASDLVR